MTGTSFFVTPRRTMEDQRTNFKQLHCVVIFQFITVRPVLTLQWTFCSFSMFSLQSVVHEHVSCWLVTFALFPAAGGGRVGDGSDSLLLPVRTGKLWPQIIVHQFLTSRPVSRELWIHFQNFVLYRPCRSHSTTTTFWRCTRRF